MQKIIFVLINLILQTDALGSAQRLEIEKKFSVPIIKQNDLWDFLIQKFGKGHKDFQVEAAKELFLDLYFDTSDLLLYNSDFSLRHRSRRVVKEERSTFKNIIQFKEKDSDSAELQWIEHKFPLKEKYSVYPDNKSIFYLIKDSHQASFFQKLNERNISFQDLRSILSLEQTRQRLYLSKNGQVYFTITLDNTSASWTFGSFSFLELEIEINENLYTRSSFDVKKQLLIDRGELLDVIKLYQFDLKPVEMTKYKKAMNYFYKESLIFRFFIKFFLI